MTYRTVRNTALFILAILGLMLGSAWWVWNHTYRSMLPALQNQVKTLESEIRSTQRKLGELQEQYGQVNDWMGKEAKARAGKRTEAVRSADADGLARILADYVRSGSSSGGNGSSASKNEAGSQ
jgi:hypothetical protein